MFDFIVKIVKLLLLLFVLYEWGIVPIGAGGVDIDIGMTDWLAATLKVVMCLLPSWDCKLVGEMKSVGEPVDSGGVNALALLSKLAVLLFVAKLSRLEVLLLRLSVFTDCGSLDWARDDTSSFEFCVDVVEFRFSLFSIRRYSLATKSNKWYGFIKNVFLGFFYAEKNRIE